MSILGETLEYNGINYRVGEDEVEITLKGDVGVDFDSKSLTSLLDQYSTKSFIFNLSSPGGYLVDGLAIHDHILHKNLDVTVVGTGEIASAATVISCAAKRVILTENTTFMVHNPFYSGEGGNDISLGKMRENIINVYSRRTSKNGVKRKKLSEMLDAGDDGMILTAREAVEYGFADEVKTFAPLAEKRQRLVAYNKQSALDVLMIAYPEIRNQTFDDYPQEATDNAKRALKWLEEKDNPNDCLTAVGFARANQLANREPLGVDTLKRMAAFRRHEKNKDVPYEEGCGGVAWDAWGGDAGIDYADRKLEQIKNEYSNKTEMAETKDTNEIEAKANLLDKFVNDVKAIFKAQKVENRIELELEGGSKVYIEPTDTERFEPEVGDMAIVDGQPAPDGTHKLNNGESITTKDGKITEIKKLEDKKENEMTKEETEALVDARISAKTEEIKAEMTNGFTEIKNLIEGTKVENKVEEPETPETPEVEEVSEVEALKAEVENLKTSLAKALNKKQEPKKDVPEGKTSRAKAETGVMSNRFKQRFGK